MLKVYTLCTGDKYDIEYVHRLQRMVQRNLTTPHEFSVVSDRDLPGVHVVGLPDLYPGWWGKINILALPGPAVFLDLDVVIVGGLDEMLGTGADIKVAKNWAQSGHGGCQSTMMYWENASMVPKAFDFDKYACWPPSNVPPKLWGDQEFLTLLRDTQHIDVEYFNPAHVVSYKYHCRQGLPNDARVVAFHGKPDPHEVNDPWVKSCWG
jgi:hypothetical protein